MEKSLRRGQTITPFGVGAILDIMQESLVAADILRWEGAGEDLHEPRLQRKLGVDYFRMAPPAPEEYRRRAEAPGVPFFRFPQWLFCHRCRRMHQVSDVKETGDAPTCRVCGSGVTLTPMRFVMACPRGHLSDVPWKEWAHQGRQGMCGDARLKFETRPGGSGLKYVQVRCGRCGARQSLAGIAQRDSMKRLGIRCGGRQPWERKDGECDAVPQVLQRGATNLTFANVASSIDIPPYSRADRYSADRLKVRQSRYFGIIASAPSAPFIDELIRQMAIDLDLDVARAREIVDQELSSGAAAGTPSPAHAPDENLLQPEFAALVRPDQEYDRHDRFIKNDVDVGSYLAGVEDSPHARVALELGEKIATVAQVTRLREVRALVGFSRLAPAVAAEVDDEEPGTFSVYKSEKKIRPTLVRADLGELPPAQRWLPAIEIYGEGVFLSLREDVVRRWETLPGVRQRVEVLMRRRERGAQFLPVPTPRLVMLHTLAHVLIRQLSFECGYSIASLRERIYCAMPGSEGPPMAGILIYTAAGDSEGTLGGLVREGEPDRLLASMIRALLRADWCSSDPICRESDGQGPGALNLAACHSCALLPETSCTLYNRLLDRVLLVGDIADASCGFFGDAVGDARAS